MTTKHPTSESVLKVINNFKKVLPLAVREDHLNMSESHVTYSRGGGCGTIHCHGGWYAVAVYDSEIVVGFLQGANKMATDLGFNNNSEIESWAYVNEDIWGNIHGHGMFCNKSAFYHRIKRPNGAENLQHIIDHWTEVYERVLALEGKKPEPQPTIEESPKVKEVIRYVSVPETINQQAKEVILN